MIGDGNTKIMQVSSNNKANLLRLSANVNINDYIMFCNYNIEMVCVILNQAF